MLGTSKAKRVRHVASRVLACIGKSVNAAGEPSSTAENVDALNVMVNLSLVIGTKLEGVAQ